MYEQSAKWNMFYQELEPKERQKMFAELQMTEPDDGANELRKKLMDARYKDPKDDTREVDNFLWQCLNLPYLYKRAKVMKFGVQKEVRKGLQDLCLDQAAEYGEAGEKAVYWEVRNAIKRYFSTCTGSHYRRKVFGVMAASEDEKKIQILKDAWQMSYGIAGIIGLEEEMKLYCQAVRDEYSTLDEGAAARFDTMEN
jgi:hypothetical protein